MKEKKDSDVGLVFLIMLMVGLVLAVMGLVFCVIKLKEEKAKNNDLTAKQNNDTKIVYDIPEEEEEIEEEEIPEEEPKEENETEKVEENKSEELSFEELMDTIYPNSTGNFNKKFSYITLDCSYDGNESEIIVTVNENDFKDTEGKVSLLRYTYPEGDYKLKEKVVDALALYEPSGKVSVIALLTKDGNVYSVPWLYRYSDNHASLIGACSNAIKLTYSEESVCAIDRDGNVIADTVSAAYADGY